MSETSASDPEHDQHGGFPKMTPADPQPEFGPFVEALRTVQDLAVSADLPEDVLRKALAQAEELVATMAPYAAREGGSPAGRAMALPGRGSLLMLPWTVEKLDKDGVRSTGMFRRFHLGGNGAAHGGTLPLLFDDAFGLIQHAHGRPISRTAFLHIDYRKITPLNTTLVVEGSVDRVEGRKTFISAKLSLPDGTVLAECHALMLELLPGQP